MSDSAGRGKKRKGDDSEAAQKDKRQANLEAQRAFQAKRKEYVANLEAEVAALRAVVAGTSNPSAATNPQIDPKKGSGGTSAAAALASNDVSELRKLVAVLGAENAMLRQEGVVVDLNMRPQKDTNQECKKCAEERVRALVAMGLAKSLEDKILDLQKQVVNNTNNNNQAASNSPSDPYGLDGLFGFASSQLDLASLLNPLQPPPASIPLQSLFSFDKPPNHAMSNQNSWFEFLEKPGSSTLLLNAQQNAITSQSTPSPSQHYNINSPSKVGTSNSQTPQSSSSNTNPPNLLPHSATDLYGPPETEFARITLKSVPSLAACSHVDALFDAFEVQGTCRDRERIKRYGLKTMALRAKILDACSVVDRQKVVELFVIFLERNRRHVAFRNTVFEEDVAANAAARRHHRLSNAHLNSTAVQSVSTTDTSKSTHLTGATVSVDSNIALKQELVEMPGQDSEGALPEESKRFRAALLAIPSLSAPEAEPLVDALCIAMYSRNTVKGYGKDKLLTIFTVGKKLERLCANVQDRTKYSIVSETFREANKKRMDELFEEMEQEDKLEQ